jgi:hypothetical protein
MPHDRLSHRAPLYGCAIVIIALGLTAFIIWLVVHVS